MARPVFLDISRKHDIPYWVVLSYADTMNHKMINSLQQRKASLYISAKYSDPVKSEFYMEMTNEITKFELVKLGMIDWITHQPVEKEKENV